LKHKTRSDIDFREPPPMDILRAPQDETKAIAKSFSKGVEFF
jgi:hypothetical protein